MSNELCKEFNMTGAKGKLALGHLKNIMAVFISKYCLVWLKFVSYFYGIWTWHNEKYVL